MPPPMPNNPAKNPAKTPQINKDMMVMAKLTKLIPKIIIKVLWFKERNYFNKSPKISLKYLYNFFL